MTNEYMREYRASHSERIREIRNLSRRKRYAEDARTRLRNEANKYVARAVSSGRLAREACPCGSPSAEAHHDSYAIPDRLAVRWLCRSCHMEWHKENAPSY